MKLYFSDASPYARLIRVILLETGLDTETDYSVVDPWTSPDELLRVNPAGKVPALVLPDGSCLIESGCIADYLIVRSARPDLYPINGGPDTAWRTEVLGLGRAAIDCAFGSVVQRRFAPESPLVERWRAALPRIVGRLEVIHSDVPPQTHIDLADLTVAVAFEYICFRLPEINWQTDAPRTAERVTRLGGRSSFQATRPK